MQTAPFKERRGVAGWGVAANLSVTFIAERGWFKEGVSPSLGV